MSELVIGKSQVMLLRCFVNIWRQHGSWMERDRLKLNLGKAKWIIWGSCTQLPFAFQKFGMTVGLELNIYVAVLTCTHEKSIHILQRYFSGQSRSITKCLANIINPLLLPLKNKINISKVFLLDNKTKHLIYDRCYLTYNVLIS